MALDPPLKCRILMDLFAQFYRRTVVLLRKGVYHCVYNQWWIQPCYGVERMDMQVLLSFSSFPAFKSLPHNYLQIENHPLFPVMEEKIGCGAEMTPTEIIEILMHKMDDPDEALDDVICALDAKKRVRDDHLISQPEGKEKFK